MPKSVIIPAGSSAPLAPFVPGTLADGVVYVSGTLAFDQATGIGRNRFQITPLGFGIKGAERER